MADTPGLPRSLAARKSRTRAGATCRLRHVVPSRARPAPAITWL